MSERLEAFFLKAGPDGRRLCLHYPAAGKARGALVYVHPLAEEMNKSRRMVALQARALAAAGYAVLQVDLHGCGDSSGEFESATWEGWINDVVRASDWLRKRNPAPLWLWGLRAGCLLAAQSATRIGCDRFLFWQPPVAGAPLLLQFLRLASVGRLGADGSQRVSTVHLQNELRAGRSVEVAGYRLAPELARGLSQAALAPPRGPGASSGRLSWLEVSSREAPELLPASTPIAEQWTQAGYTLDIRAVTGPMFWQTSEIETAPALLSATLATLAAAT